jgi:sugar phosphate isomerase/epimerase
MKLACASSSLHRDIERGELTQLEFLDLCARELACDGVVLDVRHFPRIDDDYLAQIKKMAADRGLSIAALADAGFFTATQEHMADVLGRAIALGAPLVAAPLAREIECAWTDQLTRLGLATSLAKTRNVTLALRNAPQTFAATAHDCKRVAKEADSAWLRFGLDPQRLDAASDPRALQPNTVLLWSDVALETQRSIGATIESFAGFRGHLALDESSGATTPAQLAAAIRRWQIAILDRR